MRRHGAALHAAAVAVCVAVLCVGPVVGFWDSIVSADEGTFDKIVTPETSAIVKIDQKNPHGEDMQQWKKFCEKLGEVGMARLDVLPVEVNILHQRWWNDDDDFNQGLARRFNVSIDVPDAEKFKPAIFLLRKGENWNKPVKFTDKKWTQENLIRWVQKYSADGNFELTGTSHVFDQYARRFLRAGGGGDGQKGAAARQELLDDALKELEALKDGRPRRRTKRMKKLGLGGLYSADLSPEDCEEIWEKESTAMREKEERREDLGYYITVMSLVQEYGLNAALDEKRELTRLYFERKAQDDKDQPLEELHELRNMHDKRTGTAAAKKSPYAAAARKLRRKMPLAPKRNHFHRLEAWLNILSTFRSAGAVSTVNHEEIARIRQEKLEAFAERRRKLTGRTTLP
eukprot:CAMPEP_0174843452 /NCGR_PEP_ID=MMETSP1114-20130205/10534_1 /TAXON_ID=312471 /ORGANISM="Neobodo designis, Strain CCAP 1951/1" /LENGTH=400 /DNA_ID=CAMNT_0016077677 /DNA_START=49 /DNA_END=1247 /DNA_ORIENTATION=+